MRKLVKKKRMEKDPHLVKRKKGLMSKPLVERNRKKSLYRKARGDLDKKFSKKR